MKPRFLNLVLDTLSGCDWYCQGCFVKDAKGPFDDFERAGRLIESCAKHEMRVSCIRVGPTDVFAAENSAEFLLDPRFRELAKDPKTDLALNTTLLGSPKRTEEIIRILNENYVKDYIHFNVVLNHRQIGNPGYLRKISDNIELMRRTSRHCVKFAPGVNIEPDENFLREDLKPLHEYAAKVMPELELELALNFTRHTDVDRALVNRGFDIANRIDLVSRMFSPSNIECENSFLNILWREGQWYWAPNLYYEFANAVDPRMKISFHDLDDLLESFNRLYVNQYRLEDLECTGCEFNRLCMLRFVPAYMEILERKRCIAPRKKMADVLRYAPAAPPNY